MNGQARAIMKFLDVKKFTIRIILQDKVQLVVHLQEAMVIKKPVKRVQILPVAHQNHHQNLHLIPLGKLLPVELVEVVEVMGVVELRVKLLRQVRKRKKPTKPANRMKKQQLRQPPTHPTPLTPHMPQLISRNITNTTRRAQLLTMDMKDIVNITVHHHIPNTARRKPPKNIINRRRRETIIPTQLGILDI